MTRVTKYSETEYSLFDDALNVDHVLSYLLLAISMLFYTLLYTYVINRTYRVDICNGKDQLHENLRIKKLTYQLYQFSV